MRRMLFSFFLFFFSSGYAGFSHDTAVLSPQGFISIGQLQKNSCVTSCDFTNNNYLQGIVSNHHSYISSPAYKVICDNDISFIASPNQLVMTNSEWRFVRDLKSGDCLKCYGSAYATVLSVEVCDDEQYLSEITVEPYHTFLVTPRGIVAHNHPIAIFAVAPPVISALSKVAIMGVIGGVLWSLFGKKKNKDRNHFVQESSTSGCSSPSPKKPNDEDEFRRKHPHGRYEDVGYHKNHQSGRKSPRPIDGQTALDNSFGIPGKERTRIGFSQGQFVVLNETVEGVYHGHVRVWDELRPVMQNILKDLGIVTKRGKFIK